MGKVVFVISSFQAPGNSSILWFYSHRKQNLQKSSIIASDLAFLHFSKICFVGKLLNR